MRWLDGQVALITGGGSETGRAGAFEEGARVAIVDRDAVD
jgi:NAD(P)-dependent dehydrogenase (short-subunit alcohol dehydrogenase family)